MKSSKRRAMVGRWRRRWRLPPRSSEVPMSWAVTILVENTADRDIQVTSHYHFFEVNKRLRFDRAQAFGMHLDIPPGTTIRFEPGERREVRLVEFAGGKRLIGFAGLTNAQANDETKALAL